MTAIHEVSVRSISSALTAHLGEGATTLCRCWSLRRRDGVAMGFTDHDRDLAFEGVVFAAGTGLDAAEASAELGFAVGGGDVSGALSSAGLTEADILAGRYDDAQVEAWLVNWADVSQRLLLDTYAIGEIRRSDDAFVAELRGATHRFDEERGLLYRRACAADLGDARCGVDLEDPRFRGSGAVAATDGALSVATTNLTDFADGWFTAGRLLWTGGANAGDPIEVRSHRLVDGTVALDLWQRMPAPIVAGDAFTVTAGCDKALGTCAAKFANVANHRGFPHMPGNDFILRVPLQGEAGFDGGSLFR